METAIETGRAQSKRSNWALIGSVLIGSLTNLKEAQVLIKQTYRYIQSSRTRNRDELKVYYRCKSYVSCPNMRRYDMISINQYLIWESGNHGNIHVEEVGIPQSLKTSVDQLISHKVQPRHFKRKLLEMNHERNEVDRLKISQINNRIATVHKQVHWNISNNLQWQDYIRSKRVIDMDEINFDSSPIDSPLVLSSFMYDNILTQEEIVHDQEYANWFKYLPG